MKPQAKNITTAPSTMTIDWDVQIPTSAGTIVHADVFRPSSAGHYPVIMTHGVYGKGLPFKWFVANMLANMSSHPMLEENRGADLADIVDKYATDDVAQDDYRVWEVVDPAVWVPAGYVCIRVDSRGSGSSRGYIDPLSPGEIDDYADCIEWAGTQKWSNGRVGLCGKSYYAMTQWLVAARRPRHLAAICVWHGLSDWYRDAVRHGGILYQFQQNYWYPHLVLPVQNGNGSAINPHSGLPITGEVQFDADTLAANRTDIVADIRNHPFIDDYHEQRTPDLARIEVPLLASADWSDHDLHLRGTIRGFQQVPGSNTWLEIHAGGQFDDPASTGLQMRFFDYFLKNSEHAEDDWSTQPRVQVAVRHADGSTARLDATNWPVPGTTWTPWYADFADAALARQSPAELTSCTYDAAGSGVTLTGPPIETDTTVLGPVSAKLFLSSLTTDADLFLILGAIGPDGHAVELRDHRAGLTPVSIGWQRASLRAIDPERSQPGQPYHPYLAAQPLQPNEIAEVDIELCPTSLRLPAGSRLQLTVRGNSHGHNDPFDRPTETFANRVTLYAGPDRPSHILIPTMSGQDHSPSS